jgi:hypothetical protein
VLLLDSMPAASAGAGGGGAAGSVGQVHEFVFDGAPVEDAAAALARAVAPSPHYSSIGEVMALAARLEVPFPEEVRILALTVADPYVFGEGLSPAAAGALPGFVGRGRGVLRRWCEETGSGARGGGSKAHTPKAW